MEARAYPRLPQTGGAIFRAFRWKLHLFLMMAAFSAPAPAQERLTTVRVFTNPTGVEFTVDGQLFRGPAAFTWPAGSKHELRTDLVQSAVVPRTRYTFQDWVTTGEIKVSPQTAAVTITADPAITFVRADFDVEYQLDLNFLRCSTGDGCASPGIVYIDGASPGYANGTALWFPMGKAVVLQAIPNPGYVFLGWVDEQGNVIQGFIDTVTMSSPRAASALFDFARKILLATSPPGLQLLIDRAPITTSVDPPSYVDWGFNTVHTVAPGNPQVDRTGNVWAFQSWSDGGAATHAYTVKPGSTPDVLTATFVPGARVTFMTSPPGLKVLVDGRDSWYGAYSFTWGVGETHRFEAAAEQTDAQGRKWTFKGWSNGAAAAQTITVADADAVNGVRLTASYEGLGRLTLNASVAGTAVTVDGAECRVPCVFDRPAGTQVRIAIGRGMPAGDGSRYVFQSWSDGAAAERTFTFTMDTVALSANYRLMNRLVTDADPPEGASWRRDPESADGYYDSQSQVALRVEARPGFKFKRLEGDLSGPFTSGTVNMSAPRYVRAILDRVPYVAPTGVGNAAAETPVKAVAPRSVQTLAGVAVKLGDHILPLFFVSPEQINAQLPSDVEPGQQTLTVTGAGQPDVLADFLVARNAPGLFQVAAESGAYALATHADGSAVTPDSPAHRGEIVTLYGTGLGLYTRRPMDGFAIPASPAYPLADPVEVATGDAVWQPEWAGATPGRVGVAAVRVRIAPAFPSGPVKLLIRVNGQESNTVVLPVE